MTAHRKGSTRKSKRPTQPEANSNRQSQCRNEGIYVYIRRPPSGGHQAAKRMLQSACPKSFQSFKSQVDSQVFHSFPVLQSAISSLVFHSFPALQSAISSLPVWYQLSAVCRLAFSCSAISCLAYPLFFSP